MKAGSMKGGRGGKRKGPARIGEVRVWGDGQKMQKLPGGKWVAVKEKKPAAKKTTAAPAERKTTRDETDPKPFKAVLQVTDKKGVVREKRVEFKSESEREAHIDKLKHEGKLFDVWARYDKGDKLTPEGRASFDKKPPSAKKSSKGSAAKQKSSVKFANGTTRTVGGEDFGPSLTDKWFPRKK